MKRWLACAAIAAAAGIATGTADAGPACVGLDKGGTLGPPLTVGPLCVEHGGTAVCSSDDDLGFHPTVTLDVYTCLPR